MQKILPLIVIIINLTHGEIISEKPKSFSVPLAIITTTFEGKNLAEAFVTYEGLQEGWGLTVTDDRYVKDSRKERLDYTYKEIPTQVYYLSPFETKVLDRVCESFQETLQLFEKDLRGKKWGRLLYLDNYFPPFFRGFYYLFGAARVNFTLVPSISCVADSLYDPAFNSDKSRQRISMWASDEERIVKLRIAAKELDYQIGVWRKKELSNPERDAMEDFSKPCMNAYQLFLRLYFNL